MRIESLEITNLASLKGTHLIPFTDVSNMGLFGITGETGSGKSTLLNAMTLALYGKIYKKNLNQNDLVTLGEKEASIKLLFTSRAVRYQAFWKCVIRKKTGEYLTTPRTERYLYKETDSIWTLIPESTDDVVHLTFEQFTRCIVLNQGEFARFITSPFTERKEILEKLYSGDTIDKISETIRRRIQSSHELYSKLEIQLHGLESQATLPLTEIDNSIEELKKKNTSLQRDKNDSKLLSNQLELLKSLHLKFITASQKKEEHQRLSKEKTDIYNFSQISYQDSQSELEQSEKKFKNAQSQLDQDIKTAQKLQQDLIDEERIKAELTQSVKDAELKKNQLNTLMSKKNDYLKEHEELKSQLLFNSEVSLPSELEIQKLNKTENEFKQIQREINQINQELITLTEEGQELNLKSEKITQDLIQFKKELIQKLSIEINFEFTENKIYELQQAFQNNVDTSLVETSKLELKLIEARKNQEKIHLLKDERQSLELKLAEEKTTFSKVNQELEHKQWIIHLYAIKEHLVNHPQKDCPICEGPLDHKISKHQWEQRQVDETTAKVKEMSHLQEISKSSIQSIEQKIEQLRLELTNLESDKGNDITKIQEAYLNQTEIFKNAKQNAEELSKIAHHITKILQLRIFITDQTNKLRINYQNRQNILKEKLTESKRIEKLLAEQLKAYPHLKETLNDQIQREVTLRQSIASKVKLSQDALIQIELAEIEENRIKERHLLYTQKLNELKASISSQKNFLDEKYPHTTPEIFKKMSTEHLIELNQKRNTLFQKLKEAEISLKEVLARLLTIEEQLKEIDLTFSQTIHQLNLQEQSQMLTLTIDQVPSVLPPLINECEFHQNQIDNELKNNNIKIGELTNLRFESQKRSDLALSVKEKIKIQKDIQSRNQLLYDLVGKDELRNFVLSLVESHLIQQTNHELNLLCRGRYEIKQEKNESRQSTDFLVIDKWRDGQQRKVSTLSGGETFMVSLSMALALAEMTRGQAEIEAFFIDEGFGTLDDESLEDVIQMLHSVQSRGQQIGLISHMKRLTSRLPALIHLAKDARGNSSVAIEFN